MLARSSQPITRGGNLTVLLPPSLSQLTTGELVSLREATQVILRHPGLMDDIVYVKLETFSADLSAEQEDRANAEQAGKDRAKAS